MYKYLENNSNSYQKPIKNGTIKLLGLERAKKSLRNLDVDFHDRESFDAEDFHQEISQAREKITAQKLRSSMGNKAIYLSLRALRQKYTEKDPKVIGFLSMQFNFISQMLLQLLSHAEQKLLSNYFKVTDEHLYMPLQRVYSVAAKLDFDSSVLSAVQHLLPISTDIAESITKRVVKLYPAYGLYSGNINHNKTITFSIRDVEKFQIYLWVCALSENISAIRQKLFPLCIMLYPTLKVSWEIISQIIHLLVIVISERLNTQKANTLMPYFQVVWHIFYPKVFAKNNCDMELNAYNGRKSCKPLFA